MLNDESNPGSRIEGQGSVSSFVIRHSSLTLARGPSIRLYEVAVDMKVPAAARGPERTVANQLRDLSRRLAEHRRGAEDRERGRQQRDALDAAAAVEFRAKRRGL